MTILKFNISEISSAKQRSQIEQPINYKKYRIEKIKVTPLKSKTLCEKCTHGNCTNYKICNSCNLFVDDYWYDGIFCRCIYVKNGTPCRYFEKEKEDVNSTQTPRTTCNHLDALGCDYIHSGKPIGVVLHKDDEVITVQLTDEAKHDPQIMELLGFN